MQIGAIDVVAGCARAVQQPKVANAAATLGQEQTPVQLDDLTP